MKKRLVAVALTALMPALGMLGYNEFTARRERNAEVHRQAAQLSRQAASEVGSVLEGVKGLLIATSAIPSIAEQDSASCDAVLKSVVSKLAPVRNILVLDTKGKLVCDSMGWATGMDFSDRGYFKDALQNDGLVIGEYTVSRVSNARILPMALALKKGDETIGVLATGVRLEWLQERIVERGWAASSSITIADRTGVILARSPDYEKFIGTKISDRFQYLVHEEKPGTLEIVSRDGSPRIVGYTPVSSISPLYVAAGISEAEALAPINRATAMGLMMMTIGASLALFAAVFVGNTFILHPINRIVAVLQQWRDGNTSVRTGMKGQYSELGQVGASIDGLLDELEVRRSDSERAEERRRLMARELSHRVKNTLAVVQAIARQTYKHLSVQNTVFSERISALAGAYDVLLSDDWKSGDLREVVEHTLLPHGGKRDARIQLSGPPCMLSSDAVLALSLVTHELATNAIKYGSLREPDGRLNISWACDDGRVSFKWQERDGPTVEMPATEGFGSKLIRSAFPTALDPQSATDFTPEGLEFRLSFLLSPTSEPNAVKAA